MNQACKKDDCSFYEKGILRSIESGIDNHSAFENQVKPNLDIFENVQTYSESFLFMGTKKQKHETKRKTEKTRNVQKQGKKNELTIKQGIAYFNTE